AATRPQGGRDLRPLSRATREFFRGLGAGPLALGHARGISPRARALSRRRAEARRGLQLWLVQAEQDVRGRRHLRRLPRAAPREAAPPPRRGVPASSPPRQL